MITPPLSISAKPRLTRVVPVIEDPSEPLADVMALSYPSAAQLLCCVPTWITCHQQMGSFPHSKTVTVSGEVHEHPARTQQQWFAVF